MVPQLGNCYGWQISDDPDDVTPEYTPYWKGDISQLAADAPVRGAAPVRLVSERLSRRQAAQSSRWRHHTLPCMHACHGGMGHAHMHEPSARLLSCLPSGRPACLPAWHLLP